MPGLAHKLLELLVGHAREVWSGGGVKDVSDVNEVAHRVEELNHKQVRLLRAKQNRTLQRVQSRNGLGKYKPQPCFLLKLYLCSVASQ